jgi:hypothetical protein
MVLVVVDEEVVDEEVVDEDPGAVTEVVLDDTPVGALVDVSVWPPRGWRRAARAVRSGCARAASWPIPPPHVASSAATPRHRTPTLRSPNILGG